jgi:hypothetical protein
VARAVPSVAPHIWPLIVFCFNFQHHVATYLWVLWLNCAPNTELNTDLQAQIAKYKNDLDPLRFYPIVSFGVSYNFAIR